MKKLILMLLLAATCPQLWSQKINKTAKVVNSNEDRYFRIPLIGEKAPSFTAESTNGTINFPNDFGRHWKVLFSHPMDFTSVCSTEIWELAHNQKQFDKLGVKIIEVSTDKLETHFLWKKALEILQFDDRGLVKITFPIVADENLEVSKLYGMIHSEIATSKCVRSVFIVDPNNIIQAISFYPVNIGRSIDELLRTITALQISEKEKVYTPANWNVGKNILLRTPPKIDDKNPSSDLADYFNPAWFLWFKKSN